MRRSVVGMGLLLAGLAVVPSAARADVITFFGCAQGLPGACITINMTGSLATGYEGLPVPNTLFAIPAKTPSGESYSLNDSFSWSRADGTCSGGNTSIIFNGGTCAAQNPGAMVILGKVLWSPAGAPTSPFMPTQSSLIAFTATTTPEPASLALVATGVLAIGGVGMARKRHGKSDA